MNDDAEPVVIRRCDRCGKDRILEQQTTDEPDRATCGCGTTPLDARDLEALSDRGP
ncbi:MAG TPA: hypothetical protein VM939_05390 [Gemmatimonadaceae bacterium]|nr:hypothetical protein [Gemmatimonadaceae bacterium]